ncbi:MAG: hybrid sensor histidine kinase/response regulator [Salinivirgaceae bacterium]|jgi:two-component system sensor histidine kinase/response regulator|nr:hybrid sensor histidine kinase/response regulator [Salinivirgaceae bacterium]
MILEKGQKPGSAILIVDDNPKNLEVLGKLLQVEKYEIEFATNGKVALEWLGIRQFDLILLDINMPDMNGFEVCKKIRSDPQMNNVPVIFLSAEADRESILKGFELGAQDYVTKPFDSRELLMRVKTHLSLKKSREELEELNTSLEYKVKERTLQLNEAKERAEASDRLKTAFMNNISHEVRIPLTGILSFASFIVQPDLIEEDKKNSIEVLETNCERLLNTITNYMVISLIVSGNQKVKKEVFYPALLIHDINEKFQESFVKKGLAITLEVPSFAEDFQTISDSTLIFKIADHLVSNALKFTKEGGITIGYTVKESMVVFFIKDTGVGIPTEAQQQMYDYFMQGDTSDTRGYEGSGLGLSIAQGLVKLLKGEIWCESEKGKGSTFYFTIPFGES